MIPFLGSKPPRNNAGAGLTRMFCASAPSKYAPLNRKETIKERPIAPEHLP